MQQNMIINLLEEAYKEQVRDVEGVYVREMMEIFQPIIIQLRIQTDIERSRGKICVYVKKFIDNRRREYSFCKFSGI